jgi:hypothetical protein
MDTTRLTVVLVCVLVLLAGCGGGPGGNGTNATGGENATNATGGAAGGENATTGNDTGMTNDTGMANDTGMENDTGMNATDGNMTGMNGTNMTDMNGTNMTGNATNMTGMNGTNMTGNATNATNVSGGALDVEQTRMDHTQVLTEAGSASLVVDSSVTTNETTEEFYQVVGLDLENNVTYRLDSETVDNETTRRMYYTSNGTTYVRLQQAEGEDEYQVIENATVNQTEEAALSGAFPAVAASNWTEDGNVSRNGTNLTRYTASGPDAIDQSAVDTLIPENSSVNASNATVSDYSAALFTRDDGSIYRYTFDLTLESGGENVTVSQNYRVLGVGSTNVTTPGWVDLAQERANVTADAPAANATGNATNMTNATGNATTMTGNATNMTDMNATNGTNMTGMNATNGTMNATNMTSNTTGSVNA